MYRRNVRIMGIVNVNDDSFFAPSRSCGEAVAARAGVMLEEGADIIDLGAVSSRPGAAPVSLEEEWSRLHPALESLKAAFPTLPLISVDTFRSEIVRRVLDTVGPFMVNDITAGLADPDILPLAGSLGLPFVAMHSAGPAGSPASYPEGVVKAVETYFEDFSARAASAGISEWILDPGFGFSKTDDENYELLAGLPALHRFGCEILVGVSRKRFVWRPLGLTPETSLTATQLLHLRALEHGATILRVHDVLPARQTTTIFHSLSQ